METEKMSSCFAKDVSRIIALWQSGENTFFLNTSGSTDKVKQISFTRDQLIASAKMTIQRFEIDSFDTLLLCLSPKYVAGFMMIIRGLVANCNLYLEQPSGNPLAEISEEVNIAFAAFLPYQLNHIFKVADKVTLERLNKIKTIILGGENVNTTLHDQIQNLRCKVFHTYGMTETLTHIAVKQLNGNCPDLNFKPLKGVTIRKDSRGCLVISSPSTSNKEIITNDLVNIYDNYEFEWLGRIDDIINSGGIKINPNLIAKNSESVIEHYFKGSDFFFSSIPDQDFGNRLILLIESKTPDQEKVEKFKSELRNTLDKYEFPGFIYFTDQFEKTNTGKTDRKKTINFIKQLKNEPITKKTSII